MGRLVTRGGDTMWSGGRGGGNTYVVRGRGGGNIYVVRGRGREGVGGVHLNLS